MYTFLSVNMPPGALVQVVVWSSEPGVPVDEKLVDVPPPSLLLPHRS